MAFPLPHRPSGDITLEAGDSADHAHDHSPSSRRRGPTLDGLAPFGMGSGAFVECRVSFGEEADNPLR